MLRQHCTGSELQGMSLPHLVTFTFFHAVESSSMGLVSSITSHCVSRSAWEKPVGLSTWMVFATTPWLHSAATSRMTAPDGSCLSMSTLCLQRASQRPLTGKGVSISAKNVSYAAQVNCECVDTTISMPQGTTS